MILEVLSIPKNFGSRDLRFFFSTFIESGKFTVFHYKRNRKADFNKCLCIINPAHKNSFLERYKDKVWRNHKGDFVAGTCVINEIISEEKITRFRNFCIGIPKLIPQGNVGTPTKFIIDNAESLPCRLFKRLGITLKPSKNLPPPEEVLGFHGKSFTIEEKYFQQIDDNDAEEWDRHTTYHPRYQEMRYTRNDRLPTPYHLFEQICKNPWDKGDASGLVFYTDDFFWDQKLGLDERMVDDYDVNYADQEDAIIEKKIKAQNMKPQLKFRKEFIENQKSHKRKLEQAQSTQNKIVKKRKIVINSISSDDEELDSNEEEEEMENNNNNKSNSNNVKDIITPSSSTSNSTAADDKNIIVQNHNKDKQNEGNCKTNFPCNNFAARHMARMGWTPGSGLGKNEEGLISPIEPKKRNKKEGLGFKKNKNNKKNQKYEPIYRQILRTNPQKRRKRRKTEAQIVAQIEKEEAQRKPSSPLIKSIYDYPTEPDVNLLGTYTLDEICET